MITFLLVCGLAVAVIVGLVAIPLMLASAVVWLVLLPFRILFKLIFGLGGALLGLLLAPLVVVIVAVGLVVALLGAVLSLLAPLLPVALLAFFAWAVYRLAAKRPAPPPAPPSGIWS